MQRICAWPKIWTLSGRLSSSISFRIKYISMFVIVLLATVVFWLWLFDALVLKKYYTSFGWRNFFPENSIWNTAVPLLSWFELFRGDYRSCAMFSWWNIFRLETCMNSLVKVLPYSKLNFQGKNFFTQNWCNISLRRVHQIIKVKRLQCLPFVSTRVVYCSSF
jgi:hypothetical protein